MHGYVNVGDTFRVMLGKTLRADRWENIDSSFVDDGWVLLYEGNNFKDSLRFDFNIRQYVSFSCCGAIRKTYRIVAGANNFTTVEATATAPKTCQYHFHSPGKKCKDRCRWYFPGRCEICF